MRFSEIVKKKKKGNKFQISLEQQRRNLTYRTVRFGAKRNVREQTSATQTTKNTRLKICRPNFKSHGSWLTKSLEGSRDLHNVIISMECYSIL